MTESKLLPCHGCGANDDHFVVRHFDDCGGGYAVMCVSPQGAGKSDCGCRGKLSETKAGAWENWNCRPAPTHTRTPEVQSDIYHLQGQTAQEKYDWSDLLAYITQLEASQPPVQPAAIKPLPVPFLQDERRKYLSVDFQDIPLGVLSFDNVTVTPELLAHHNASRKIYGGREPLELPLRQYTPCPARALREALAQAKKDIVWVITCSSLTGAESGTLNGTVRLINAALAPVAKEG